MSMSMSMNMNMYTSMYEQAHVHVHVYVHVVHAACAIRGLTYCGARSACRKTWLDVWLLIARLIHYT